MNFQTIFSSSSSLFNQMFVFQSSSDIKGQPFIHRLRRLPFVIFLNINWYSKSIFKFFLFFSFYLTYRLRGLLFVIFVILLLLQAEIIFLCHPFVLFFEINQFSKSIVILFNFSSSILVGLNPILSEVFPSFLNYTSCFSLLIFFQTCLFECENSALNPPFRRSSPWFFTRDKLVFYCSSSPSSTIASIPQINKFN